MNERTPVSAYSLLSSPSIKQKLYVNSHQSPCILLFPSHYKLFKCEIKIPKPLKLKVVVDYFFMKFSFLLIGFSKEIFENVFHKWGTCWGYMKLSTRSKKSKTYYPGENDLLQMLFLERSFCRLF